MGDELRELGEFGLIGRFRRHAVSGGRVELGIGDDAAVIRMSGDRLVWTVDTLVDGTHFRLGAIDPVDLGYKSLAVNVSDIAAMGARPVAALLALVVPKDSPVDFLDSFWEGLSECARRYECAVAGGDTTSGPVLTITVTVAGEAGTRIVTRSGAKPGELVCVTGTLGGSAAGLAVIEAGVSSTDEAPVRRAIRAHVRPDARVTFGRAAAEHGATAMIDVSDGLVADLGHICEESGVGMGVDVDAVPLPEGLGLLGKELGRDPLDWALYGGEDYELAMTVPRNRVEALRMSVEESGGVFSVIGTVTEGREVRLTGEGPRRSIDRRGWDHFAR